MDPITPELLHHLLTFLIVNLSVANWEQTTIFEVVRLACRVLFYSMVRISNLVPNSSTSFNPWQQSTWDRVIVHPGGVVLRMDLTKTIQSAARHHEVALQNALAPPIVLWRQLGEWLL